MRSGRVLRSCGAGRLRSRQAQAPHQTRHRRPTQAYISDMVPTITDALYDINPVWLMSATREC
jgi:hypothetical protein